MSYAVCDAWLFISNFNNYNSLQVCWILKENDTKVVLKNLSELSRKSIDLSNTDDQRR